MNPTLGSVIFRFDGLDADAHKLDLFALGESLQGLARIAAVAGHFASTQEYSRYFSVHDVRVLAKEPRANCFTIEATWEFIKQHQILSGSFGLLGTAIIGWIFTANANKVAEMKLLKDSLDRAIRELGNRDDKVVMGMLAVLERMAVELRPAAKLAISPMGKSADSFSITSGDGTVSNSYNLQDAEEIRRLADGEISDVRTLVVRISELDTKRGTCKVHIPDEPEDKRVNAIISDPLLQIPNSRYALALASGEAIAVRAKLQSKDGALAKIYISDIET